MTAPVISVVSVQPLENYRLHIALSNGKVGIFDVSPYLDKGIFCELRNLDYFAKVRQFFIGVGWPHGQDISPGKIESEWQLLSEENDAPAYFAEDNRLDYRPVQDKPLTLDTFPPKKRTY